MASFYGNMKNNSRASFIFDRVYPSRVAMENMLDRKDDEGKSIGDGIFINRYVLVDYHYMLMDDISNKDKIDEYYIEVDQGVVNPQNISAYYTKSVDSNGKSIYTRATTYTGNTQTKYYQRKVFVDRFKPDTQINANNENNNQPNEIQSVTSELLENDAYYAHRYADWEKYRADYDCTVWMKIYADNKERYIMVAELDAQAPILEFIDDAPSCIDGTGHFDVHVSTDLNYVYFIPRNWDLVLNKYNPNDKLQRTVNDNTYWYYQDDKQPNELWYEDYILTNDTTAQLGKSYYNLIFTPYTTDELPVGTSIKNLHCYIPKYELVPLTDASDSVVGYYELINGKYVLTEDSNNQGKNYYNKINGQYMAADEATALKDVEYFYIESIERKTGLLINQSSVIGFYELNNKKKTFDNTVEYPYFNAAGFDPKVSTHVSEKGQGVFVKKVPSTQQYPVHKFVHAGLLTTSTWLPNRYYTYHGTKALVIGSTYNRDYAYYIGPTTLSTNPPEDGVCQLVALIVNDSGEYMPAQQPGANQALYYDDDISNLDSFKKATSFSTNTAYYEITTDLNADGTKKYAQDDDTYRIDIYLPELGNTVASIYDAIYGAPKIQADKNDGYNNIVGYCSQDQWISYNLVGYTTIDQKSSFEVSDNADENKYGTAADDKFSLTPAQLSEIKAHSEKTEDIIGYCSAEELENYEQSENGAYISILNSRFNLTSAQQEALSPEKNEETGQIYAIYRTTTTYNIPVYTMDGTGMYWAANKIFDLSQDEYNNLSPEIYPGLYDIPVYAATGSNIRPYNDERLKSTLAPPYDNLEGEDDVSVGWSLTLLKRYLSELRELAYGSGAGEDGQGVGLQSDWVLDDAEAFGYIHHRPNIIVNYTPVANQSETMALPNKTYYKEYVENGEVKYEALSDHYERLIKKHYLDAPNAPLDFLTNPLYYKDEKEIYKQITASNYSTVYDPNNVKKPVPIQTDAAEYVNYYVLDQDTGIYKHTISYSSQWQYYQFNDLTIDDYNNNSWKHKRAVIGYHEITNAPPADYTGNFYVLLPLNHDYEGTIYTDEVTHQQFRDFVPSDLIGYWCNIDDNSSNGLEQITAENCNQVGNRQVYSFNTENYTYDLFQYVGFYYSQTDYIYEPFTISNYNPNEYIWVETVSGSGEYRVVTAQDYVGYYYYTYDVSYVQISENNYMSGQKLYKQIGNTDNYSEFTYQDLIDKDFYVYIPEQLRYYQISTITDNQNNTINWEDISPGTDIYVYMHNSDTSINVGDSLNKDFIVFELPKTLSNGLQENRLEYKQCNIFSIYNSSTKYYTQDVSGQFKDATYPIITQVVSPIATNYVDAGLVRYDHGYQITVDTNNHIIKRVYSSCVAGTTQDSKALYYAINDNGTIKGKCVDNFSIIIEQIDSTTNDAYDISSEVEKLQSNLPRQTILDILNSGSETSFIDNYGATYVIDTFHNNWPEYESEDYTGFYYVQLRSKTNEVPLNEQYFLQEPTRYFVLEQVPAEQDDYEIHNIWNRVLNKVMIEP